MDAQIALNWLTAALGAATVWMAFETRRMASASKEAIELESRAYLAFRGIDLKTATLIDFSTNTPIPGIRVALRLGNPGKVLVHYHVNSVSCSLTFSDGDMAKLGTKGSVIFPGEETLYILPFGPINQVGNVAPTSQVKFEIAFWSGESVRQRLSATVTFNVVGLQPLDWQWVFVQGPSYA